MAAGGETVVMEVAAIEGAEARWSGAAALLLLRVLHHEHRRPRARRAQMQRLGDGRSEAARQRAVVGSVVRVAPSHRVDAPRLQARLLLLLQRRRLAVRPHAAPLRAAVSCAASSAAALLRGLLCLGAAEQGESLVAGAQLAPAVPHEAAARVVAAAALVALVLDRRRVGSGQSDACAAGNGAWHWGWHGRGCWCRAWAAVWWLRRTPRVAQAEVEPGQLQRRLEPEARPAVRVLADRGVRAAKHARGLAAHALAASAFAACALGGDGIVRQHKRPERAAAGAAAIRSLKRPPGEEAQRRAQVVADLGELLEVAACATLVRVALPGQLAPSSLQPIALKDVRRVLGAVGPALCSRRWRRWLCILHHAVGRRLP